MSNGSNPGLKRVQMRVITAVFVIFTLTCSGTFGMEDVVSSSGPGLTLILLLVLPILWSLPMALISSELGSALPEEGGFYHWTRRSLGEFWGFETAWWWLLSLFVDTSVYIVLTVDYIVPRLHMNHWERYLLAFAIVVVFTYVNIRGLELTGWVLTAIQVIVIVPFVVLTIWGFAKYKANPFHPFLATGHGVRGFVSSSNLGLAILMWMYSGYESMSTVSGELKEPQRVIPRALMIAVPLVIAFYFLTTAGSIAGTGRWADYASSGGFSFIDAGRVIIGPVLVGGLLASAIAGNIGLFTGYLATGSRPAYVLSKDKLLVKWLGAEHRRWGTPYRAILLMAVIDAVLIIGPFQKLIVIDVYLLMISYIPIFVAAINLRRTEPDLERPFRIKLPTWGVAAMCVPPTAIAVYALFTNGITYTVAGCLAVLTGPAAYLLFKTVYGGVPDGLKPVPPVHEGMRTGARVFAALGGLALVALGIYVVAGGVHMATGWRLAGMNHSWMAAVIVVLCLAGGFVAIAMGAIGRLSVASSGLTVLAIAILGFVVVIMHPGSQKLWFETYATPAVLLALSGFVAGMDLNRRKNAGLGTFIATGVASEVAPEPATD
jgi:amino acid transporter